VTSDYPLRRASQSGLTVSLLPFPDASGVSTSGLEYPLYDATLSAGTTLGLSNVTTGSEIVVSVKTGQALVFFVKEIKI